VCACVSPVNTYVYFAVDVDHIPRGLKLSNVRVAQQRVLLVGVEQREILHYNSYTTQSTPHSASLYLSLRPCRKWGG